MWLADENIPGRAIAFLRERGEDVVAVGEICPGKSDQEVLALAIMQERILLSFDRDHGDLVFNRGFAAPRGIVFFRLSPPDPTEIERILAILLDRGAAALDGQFTVVYADVIRQRPLPAAG
jgi:predicted nuclease of predicted toxin-antitoxin system